jgi:dihydrofolate reductase (trimethoprim resistance protein)
MTQNEATDAAIDRVIDLARRTLWIAWNWNDHNFKGAHTYARETAIENGINSFEEANEFLETIRAALKPENAGSVLEKEERSHVRTIEQRDHAQDMADKLAQKIADYAGEDIGEHSNANCPWENALEIDLSAAPPVAAMPKGKFQLGERVTKIKGSKWTGKVVGYYSTDLTPEGYAVESETETGSVQIYPAAALIQAEKDGE